MVVGGLEIGLGRIIFNAQLIFKCYKIKNFR